MTLDGTGGADDAGLLIKGGASFDDTINVLTDVTLTFGANANLVSDLTNSQTNLNGDGTIVNKGSMLFSSLGGSVEINPDNFTNDENITFDGVQNADISNPGTLVGGNYAGGFINVGVIELKNEASLTVTPNDGTFIISGAFDVMDDDATGSVRSLFRMAARPTSITLRTEALIFWISGSD